MEDKIKSFGAKIAGYLAIGEAIKQGTEIGKEVYEDFEDSVARVKGALGETDDKRDRLHRSSRMFMRLDLVKVWIELPKPL